MIQGAVNKRLRCRRAVFGKDLLFQGTGIDADTNRNAGSRTCVSDGAHMRVVADVSRIDTDFIDARRDTI